MWNSEFAKTRKRMPPRATRSDRSARTLRFSARERAGKGWAHKSALIGLTGIALGATGILLWFGAQAINRNLFRQNDIFRLREIKIECYGEVITRRHILEYTRLNEAANLFDININALRNQLLRDVPRLQFVEIIRRLPGELIIRVRERVESAKLETNDSFLSIDSYGYVLGPATSSRNLPVISGYTQSGIRPGIQLTANSIRQALEIIDVCQTTALGRQLRIASINAGKNNALEIQLADGERALLAWRNMDDFSALARENLENKLELFAESIHDAAKRGKRIIFIDMTFENNFPAQEVSS